MTDTTTPWHVDLSVDQQLALRTAAERLADLERRVRRLLNHLQIPTS